MKTLTFILALCLLGCGDETSAYSSDKRPSDLELLVMTKPLLGLFGVEELPFPIYFDDIEEAPIGIVAVCSSYIESKRAINIRVRPDKWVRLNQAQKEAAILHELGHCLRFLPHTEQPNEMMSTNLEETTKCIKDHGLVQCFKRALLIK